MSGISGLFTLMGLSMSHRHIRRWTTDQSHLLSASLTPSPLACQMHPYVTVLHSHSRLPTFIPITLCGAGHQDDTGRIGGSRIPDCHIAVNYSCVISQVIQAMFSSQDMACIAQVESHLSVFYQIFCIPVARNNPPNTTNNTLTTICNKHITEIIIDIFSIFNK